MVNLLYTVSTAIGERVALLEDMVVSSSERGQGVGSNIIKQAVDFAKVKGCKRITLLTDDDNSGAHRFYERHGFSRSSMVAFRMFLDGEC
jgi:GNAT superfamily N-acetyltransferase